MTSVIIDPRYCGPPGIGNGGYVAGTLAAALGSSDVAVMLRAPAPLGRPLTIDADADSARLSDGDVLVAEARRQPLDLAIPDAPGAAQAAAAEARFDAAAHLYPGCFVCGPDRAADDGLRLFPGPLGEGAVAASWTAPTGEPDPRLVWAVLDCPGYFAVQVAAGRALLASMTARIERPPRPGEQLIVHGWSLGSEGRKHRAATALRAADGTVLAAASQLWVTLAGA